MPPPRYVVKSGDTLWAIAGATLGNSLEWPRLWRYNNRREVIKVTGRGIPNPDLIYPGQILLLPIVPEVPEQGRGRTSPPSTRPTRTTPSRTSTSTSSPGSGSLSRQLQDIQSPISFKYKLDDLKFPPIDTPTATIEMRMQGDVVLMTEKKYPAVYVTSRREIEAQVTQSANTAFGSLVSDNRVIYDGVSKNLTLRTMLVSQSTTPNAPSTAVGFQMDSKSLIPKLRFEVRYPKLEGSIGAFKYVAVGITAVIELTPKPPPGGGPSAQPVRYTQPSIDWRMVGGIGLLVVGTVIVVGTIVEDFLTLGGGVADDPASFAAAGASFARGAALLSAGEAVLPVATAATLSLSVIVAPTITNAAQVSRRR